jgi:hypothetical protein
MRPNFKNIQQKNEWWSGSSSKSTCLARMKPRVQILVLVKKKEMETLFQNYPTQISSGRLSHLMESLSGQLDVLSSNSITTNNLNKEKRKGKS